MKYSSSTSGCQEQQLIVLARDIKQAHASMIKLGIMGICVHFIKY
nr:unnamed protein product [Callosobruchus analis]